MFIHHLDGTENNRLTSLGSGSDSEEDEDDKPMFGEGDNDYYEQLVIIKISIKNKHYYIF